MPTAEEALVPQAIGALPAAFLSTLQNASLYIFADVAGYNNYFSATGTPFALPPGLLGSTPNSFLDIAAIFETTGSGVNYLPYLRGNMMHEIAHRLDLDTISAGLPSSAPAFINAANATQSAMTGTWPAPASPSCQQVFGATSPLCNPVPVISPWNQYSNVFIAGQDRNKELFADAFQNCSNQELQSVSKNNALQSIYKKDLWTYMNTSFWPGGCPRQE